MTALSARTFAAIGAILPAALLLSCASGPGGGWGTGEEGGDAYLWSEDSTFVPVHVEGVQQGYSEKRAQAGGRMSALLAGGRFAEALALADSVIAREKADAVILGQRAQALAGLGRTDDATSAFEEAILATYYLCENHLNFGVFLMRIGKIGRADSELREAKLFCEGKNLALIHRNLAVAGIKLGKPKQALADADEGLEAFPEDPYLLGLKAMLISAARPAEAESLFARSQRGGAASADFLYQYGILLMNAGRPVEAVGALDRAIALEPGSPAIGLARAGALERAGRYAEAEEAYRALIAEGKGDGAREGLARALQRAGKCAEALEIYGTLGETPENLDRAAACLHKLGRTDEAIASERKAVAMRPGWPQGMMNLAVYLAAAGEIDEAERLLEEMIAADPENATAKVNLERIRAARAKGR